MSGPGQITAAGRRAAAQAAKGMPARGPAEPREHAALPWRHSGSAAPAALAPLMGTEGVIGGFRVRTVAGTQQARVHQAPYGGRADGSREGTKNEKLAFLVVEQLMPDAPPRLRAPAIAELSQLAAKDLIALWRLDAMPSDDRETAALSRKLGRPDIFERFRQRTRIAAAISEARSAGLCEAAEGLSSHPTLD